MPHANAPLFVEGRRRLIERSVSGGSRGRSMPVKQSVEGGLSLVVSSPCGWYSARRRGALGDPPDPSTDPQERVDTAA